MWTVGLAAGKQGDQLLKHIDHALKGANGNELVDAVAAIGTGGQVGAGQPAEGELRAVGAAADGDDVRLYAGRLKGLLGGISTCTRSSPRSAFIKSAMRCSLSIF